MLHILLLAVHALPFSAAYEGHVISGEYNQTKDDKPRLVVGTHANYVQAVMQGSQNQWEVVSKTLGKTHLHSYSVDPSGIHAHVRATESGEYYRVFLPQFKDINSVTAAAVEALIRMHAAISSRLGMTSKQLVDFIVPKPIQDFLNTEEPTFEQINAALPELPKVMHALQKTQYALSQKRYYSGAAYIEEKEYLEQQQRTVLEYLEKLYSKTNSILTGDVAQKLSSPTAVKQFIELLLSNDDSNSKLNVNTRLPPLETKMSGVTSLDLSLVPDAQLRATTKPEPYAENVQALLKRHVFVNSLTAPATLKTITKVELLEQIAKTLFIEMSNISILDIINEYMNEYVEQDKDFKPVFDENMPKFDQDKNLQENTDKTATYGAQHYPQFQKQWDELKATSAEHLEKFFTSPDNREMMKVFGEIYFRLALSAFCKEMVKATSNDQFKKNWTDLDELVMSHTMDIRTKTRKQIYADGFTNVINEMKRRFDDAASNPQLASIKEQLIYGATGIWRPEDNDENNKSEQDKIRAMSPEAAKTLEEMAEIPFPTNDDSTAAAPPY